MAREMKDVNGDGDTDDGLTLSISGNEGVLQDSDITWETFSEGPQGREISAIAFGSDDTVWFATDNGGLFKYDDGIWTRYTKDDGLASNATNSITIDSDGVLWIGTYSGISRFVPPEPTLVETGESSPAEFAITGNFPNPFNPETTIQFTLQKEETVSLEIYNIMGQKNPYAHIGYHERGQSYGSLGRP